METQLLDNICCPECRSNLCMLKRSEISSAEPEILQCECCERSFSIEDGKINFLSDEDIVRFSKRFEVMRAMYNTFYSPLTNLLFSICGGVSNARHEVIDALEVPQGAKILETGIGTGDNIPVFNGVFSSCDYYGIDIQQRMLKMCSRNLRKWKMDANLFVATAEKLPFRDKNFDVVYHLGAINIFRDKKKAIEEMIRVAKPGTKIVIADENQKAVQLFDFFSGQKSEVVPPVDLIPECMQDITLSDIWKGYGYLIEFKVPA